MFIIFYQKKVKITSHCVWEALIHFGIISEVKVLRVLEKTLNKKNFDITS